MMIKIESLLPILDPDKSSEIVRDWSHVRKIGEEIDGQQMYLVAGEPITENGPLGVKLFGWALSDGTGWQSHGGWSWDEDFAAAQGAAVLARRRKTMRDDGFSTCSGCGIPCDRAYCAECEYAAAEFSVMDLVRRG